MVENYLSDCCIFLSHVLCFWATSEIFFLKWRFVLKHLISLPAGLYTLFPCTLNTTASSENPNIYYNSTNCQLKSGCLQPSVERLVPVGPVKNFENYFCCSFILLKIFYWIFYMGTLRSFDGLFHLGNNFPSENISKTYFPRKVFHNYSQKMLS